MAAFDFDRLYLDHKERVWNIIAKYVAGQHDREDLFQEVFLKIHRALPRFRGESSLETWIYQITVNTAINFLNKRQRYQKLKELLGSFRLFEAEEEKTETDAGVWAPLAKLNPRQRMILLLADVEEMKLEEIGKLLKMPVGTVKSSLHRAREIIKKELKQDGRL